MLRTLFAAAALLLACAPAARAQTQHLSVSAVIVSPVRAEQAAPALSAEVRGDRVWLEARSALPEKNELLVDVSVSSARGVADGRVRGRGRAGVALPGGGAEPVEVRVVIAVNA
ncbi:MAG TPA: hypothetical protein VFQ45_14510 [Longimicrobium sp.]|nr:hypothetical protein [Longimicrobium sp.]